MTWEEVDLARLCYRVEGGRVEGRHGVPLLPDGQVHLHRGAEEAAVLALALLRVVAGVLLEGREGHRAGDGLVDREGGELAGFALVRPLVPAPDDDADPYKEEDEERHADALLSVGGERGPLTTPTPMATLAVLAPLCGVARGAGGIVGGGV